MLLQKIINEVTTMLLEKVTMLQQRIISVTLSPNTDYRYIIYYMIHVMCFYYFNGVSKPFKSIHQIKF